MRPLVSYSVPDPESSQGTGDLQLVHHAWCHVLVVVSAQGPLLAVHGAVTQMVTYGTTKCLDPLWLYSLAPSSRASQTVLLRWVTHSIIARVRILGYKRIRGK